MRITVLADESGTVIGVAQHPQGESRDSHPQGIRIVPRNGQVAVTIDAPEELAGRQLGAGYFQILRRYIVRGGSLVKRH